MTGGHPLVWSEERRLTQEPVVEAPNRTHHMEVDGMVPGMTSFLYEQGGSQFHVSDLRTEGFYSILYW